MAESVTDRETATMQTKCWGPGLPETRQAGRRCAEKRESGQDRPLQPLAAQLEAGQLDCRRDGSWAIHPKGGGDRIRNRINRRLV
jgi:hypothetical protein